MYSYNALKQAGCMQDGRVVNFVDKLSGKQSTQVSGIVLLPASQMMLACGEDGNVLVCV